jgi:hypothetical protein
MFNKVLYSNGWLYNASVIPVFWIRRHITVVFWSVMPCSLIDRYQCLGELTASIFRLEELTQWHIPGQYTLAIDCCKNLKSYLSSYLFKMPITLQWTNIFNIFFYSFIQLSVSLSWPLKYMLCDIIKHVIMFEPTCINQSMWPLEGLHELYVHI